MSIFGGVSVDKSSNLLDTLNQSTVSQVKEKNTSCAANIEQFLGGEINVGGSVGGSIDVQNVAGLMSKCVQTSKDQDEIIDDIANTVAQKHTTDKGGSGLVTLASVNLQDNQATVKNILKKEYKDIVNLNCDTSIVQKQANKINIGGSVGGNITSKNTATLSSDCQQIADLNRRVATTLANDFTQSTETKIPSIIAYIVIGLVIIAVISGLVYAFAGDNAPERRRKFRQGISANFPGQQFTAPLLTAPPPQQYTDPNVYSEPLPQYQEPIQQLQQPLPLDASQIALK